MREYMLIVVVSAAMAYFLGGAARRFAARIGAITPIRDRDVHSVPIPRLGGLAVVGGVAAAFVLATNLPFLGEIPEVSRDAWVLLAAGIVIAVVGGIDDVVDLDSITKLAGQTVAAGLVVVSGIQLNWIPLPNGETLALSPEQGAVASAVLIVGSANAVNFIDGLDGLCAGVVGIGAAAFCAYAYSLAYMSTGLSRATTATLVTAAVAGACIGFLPHNFFPARVFMGDAGAYFLGLLLASSTISLTGWLDPAVVREQGGGSLLPAWLPLILPISILIVPFVDLLLAVIRRTKEGRSPFDADMQHLHHRLQRMGHSHPRTVLIMYVWAGLGAFGVTIVGLRANWVTGIAFCIAIALAVLFTTLLPHHTTRPRPR